jgi:hypothetical protein
MLLNRPGVAAGMVGVMNGMYMLVRGVVWTMDEKCGGVNLFLDWVYVSELRFPMVRVVASWNRCRVRQPRTELGIPMSMTVPRYR